MNHNEIKQALKNLQPNAEWSLSGDNYADIVWLSQETQPTHAEIEVEIALLPGKAAAAKIEAETKKQAILDRLNLTSDEAKLLLS